MKIGISVLPTDYSPDIVEIAKEAERLNFESLWVEDHPILPVNVFTENVDGAKISKILADVADPFISLARASSVTKKLKLATGPCLVAERNPLLLSKEVASIDMFSKGRFFFGIGVASFKEEILIMGGDLQNIWANVEESILAMQELWLKTKSQFSGKYYNFPPVFSFPSPVSKPYPPILVYGNHEESFDYITKWGDGWVVKNIHPDELGFQKLKLDQMIVKSGRDVKMSVTIAKASVDLSLINDFKLAGADRIIVDLFSYDSEQSIESLQDIASKIELY